jgi:tetratricopeptide (TPR) repeat protein
MMERAFLLRAEQYWPEATAAAQRVVDRYPHMDSAQFFLGMCKVHTGRSDEAIPLFEAALPAVRANMLLWWRYYRLGQAMEITGHYKEAVDWLQRGIAADPEISAATLALEKYWLASAEALNGDTEIAREEIAEATASRSWWSARSFMAWFVANPAFESQLDRVRDGLRLAGVHDHDNEDEGGPAVTSSLFRNDMGGQITPQSVPGVRTVRTSQMPDLLRTPGTIVVDANNGSPSIPGAVSLGWFGGGTSLSDPTQALLRKVLDQLSAGDLKRPLVILGISAHSVGAYNLALRAVSLGYSNVMWYRGGRDSWGAAGLPLVPVVRIRLPTG